MTSKQKREVNAQASNPDDSNLVNFLGENQSANGGRTKKEESGKGEKTYIDDGVCGDKSDKRRRRKKEKVPKPANDTSVAVSEPQNMKELAHEGGLHKEKDLPWKSLGPDFVSPQIPGKYYSEGELLPSVGLVSSDSFSFLGPNFFCMLLFLLKFSCFCLICQIQLLFFMRNDMSTVGY